MSNQRIWHYVDLRHQKNGQIRIIDPHDNHVANVLASGPDALSAAEFIVESCNTNPRGTVRWPYWMPEKQKAKL